MNCCSPNFWRFFLELHSLSGVAINAALGAAKNLFAMQDPDFPATKRTLLRKIAQIPQNFWPHIMHTTKISLQRFRLPDVEFKFIDPLFAWAIVARKQRADDMHFMPAPKTNAFGDSIYGGGVQQGKSFLAACRSCPPGDNTF